jgi:hypothetical protein
MVGLTGMLFCSGAILMLEGKRNYKTLGLCLMGITLFLATEAGALSERLARTKQFPAKVLRCPTCGQVRP